MGCCLPKRLAEDDDDRILLAEEEQDAYGFTVDDYCHHCDAFTNKLPPSVQDGVPVLLCNCCREYTEI